MALCVVLSESTVNSSGSFLGDDEVDTSITASIVSINPFRCRKTL